MDMSASLVPAAAGRFILPAPPAPPLSSTSPASSAIVTEIDTDTAEPRVPRKDGEESQSAPPKDDASDSMLASVPPSSSPSPLMEDQVPDALLVASLTPAAPKSLITVESGCKSYGKQSVLDNLSIDVKQGTIYALLGASGCGKTTLLSCIVGTKRLNSGWITFRGQDLDHIRARSGGLRAHVGYMPQEVALYKEFTIREALLYFGRIYGMGRGDILERGRFLVGLLHLPEWGTEIRKMSGGQQRRTSFACALIHSPKLLILDEPTVGVDPLLRKSIWEYLTTLVRAADSTTVIITTHYIDEAKAANTVGLMRSGRILAEGPPAVLMERHHAGSLEHLFLVLSQEDETKIKLKEAERSNKVDKEKMVLGKNASAKKKVHFKAGAGARDLNGALDALERHRPVARRRLPRIFPYPGYSSRLGALIMKNFVYIWRQILFIFFLLMFPAIQIFLCCWAIGTEPWALPFGVINLEPGVDADPDSGCSLIQILNKSETFKLIEYGSEKNALDAMVNGAIYGFAVLAPDFSAKVENQVYAAARQRRPKDTLEPRIPMGQDETKSLRTSSAPLSVQLDQTSRHITISIQKAIGEAYRELIGCVRKREQAKAENSNFFTAFFTAVTKATTNQSTTDSKVDYGPIHYDPPIYGHSRPTIVIDYVGPGLVLGVIFFAAISITGLSYVVEKKEGMLERSLVAGVSPSEIIMAHLLSQSFIVVLQTSICLAVLFGGFNVPVHGGCPLVGVVVLAVLQGFLGMFAGFVLSSVCDEEKVVMQWSLAITLPMVVVAGIFWPTAGMPEILQYVAYVFVPQSWAAESMRSMLGRGWGVLHPKVWPGFAVTLGYSVGLWTVANVFANR